MAASSLLGSAKVAASQQEVDRSVQPAAQQNDHGILYHPDWYRSDVMKGFPPPREKRVTIHNWHIDADTVRYTHLHDDHVFRTTAILPDSSRTWALPRRMIDPAKLERGTVLWGPTEADAERISVAQWLQRSHTDALVAIHDGHIVAEQYFGEMTEATRHSVWSSSKSVIAMLLAGLLADGRLGEHDRVEDRIPDLAGSAFDGATVRQVMDQTTGIELKTFPSEQELARMTDRERREYDLGSPEFCRAQHDLAKLLRTIGCFPLLAGEESRGIYDLPLTLKRSRKHGSCFYYADGNPNVAQWLLERITGMDFVDQVTAFWQRIGAEHAATLRLDQVATAVGTVGLAMTARDYARLGLVMVNRGQVGNGDHLPGIADLVDQLKHDPGPERWTEETNFVGQTRPGNGYKNFFWVFVDKTRGDVIPFLAGLHGQRVYFDPARNVVLAKFSTRLGHSREEEVACPSFVKLLPQLVG